jgi:hypothetical protein
MAVVTRKRAKVLVVLMCNMEKHEAALRILDTNCYSSRGSKNIPDVHGLKGLAIMHHTSRTRSSGKSDGADRRLAENAYLQTRFA